MSQYAPTMHELELIELLGETMAARTYCERCGKVLGRGLTLMPSAPPPADGSWRLLIVTRCRGWWRHAYIAEVVDLADDLQFGRFYRN